MKQPFPALLKSRGFALVVTLSLMILLTLVAVGLLSLSAISMRNSAQAKAQAEARANARLALMFALGDLQKHMGPDQRISANGAITDTDPLKVKHPHWTGVWNSWKAGTGEASQHSTIGSQPDTAMRPTYQARREDYFRSWLLSLNPGEIQSVSSPMNVSITGSSMPEFGATAVELVGKGSLGTNGDPKEYVSARLLSVKATTGTNPAGRYGWWVGDESQKARIMDDSYLASSASLKMADKIFRSQAPGSTGTKTVKGLESMTDDTQLAGLPSLKSLDIVSGATGKPAENFHSATPFSYQVLVDVREGGLKRDLSTLLERNISLSENGNDFMLYKFQTHEQDFVPIQDLAAYYQLYNGFSNGRKQGVQYASTPSNLLNNGIQSASPDFYNSAKENSFDTYLREYTNLYRSPVPVKIQFLLGMTCTTRTPTALNSDTHKLQLGITPSITLWNPTNVPLVMNFGTPAVAAQLFRLMNLPIRIAWEKNNGYATKTPIDMNWATHGGFTGKANIFSVYFSGTRSIVFKPGEVRVFSLPYRTGNMSFSKTDNFIERHELGPGWDADAFLLMPRSDASTSNPADPNDPVARNVDGSCLTFSAGDKIGFRIDNSNPSNRTEGNGSAMNFMMIQTSLQNQTTGEWSMRHYMFNSRVGSGARTQAFNTSLMNKGFPGKNQTQIVSSEAVEARDIIATSGSGSAKSFLRFALMAGCEINESSSAGGFAGRKFASRPFLHSTAISSSFIDRDDYDSFYNYGWNWWIQEANSAFDGDVGTNPLNPNQGYYGGGYTSGEGTSYVVQQEVPVAPPISIASLSHAHLGGFSLANESIAPGNDKNQRYNSLVNAHTLETYQRTTATGHGGLFPHTLQAIGNSYAHPHVPANQAFTTWSRRYSEDQTDKNKTLADHSYLANKALWDEFFFSSITPQPSKVKAFENTSDLDAKTVAKKFFFDKTPLPNRRMTAYNTGLDQTKFNALFTPSQQQQFSSGLADKIATYLMVEGPFNINSTSVAAWEVLLSSLKGKPVAYLDKDLSLSGGVKLDQTTPDGTPVGAFSLPNGKPVKGSSDEPSDEEQWTSSRDLSETEIKELAAAIVKQVKLRGPFLSLSEFVNRRLDSNNKELSVKGALQAALDDTTVSINAGFREAAREFSRTELASMNPAFPDALKGPVAYGSSAYVDQADILRNFSEQLTPRGDTFVIRTYGDSLDASRKVQARAWCEAVVQRIPEYVDSADESHIKQASLTSQANKTYGRKFQIVSFRWLDPLEV